MSRILVVDDEPDVLDALCQAVRANLHDEVIGAATPAVALEVLAERPVDLLLSDQRMPGMDGLQLIREARRLQPTLSTILITAWGFDTLLGMGSGAAEQRMLQKPFSLAALLAECRQALAERRPPAPPSPLTSRLLVLDA